MNTQITSEPSLQTEKSEFRFKLSERSLKMKKNILFFFYLITIVLLSSCSFTGKEDETPCHINLEKPVSIDVENVPPRDVFDQLAGELGCDISVSPFLWKHVTLQVENTPIYKVISLVCPQIGCKEINYGNRLAIKPLTIFDKIRAKQWKEFNKMMDERNRILQSRLPDGMSFEDVPLSTVLEEISKVSGLELKPWQDEGDRKVSIDLSGMVIEEALKAVVLYVDGEGAVLIHQKYFLHESWGQIWLWDYPLNF